MIECALQVGNDFETFFCEMPGDIIMWIDCRFVYRHGRRHAKPGLKNFVVIILKEGFAGSSPDKTLFNDTNYRIIHYVAFTDYNL